MTTEHESQDVTTPLPAVDAQDAAAQGTDAPRTGLYLGARQAYTALAAVLAFVLVALIIYLVYLLWPQSFVTKGGQTKYGLKPVMSIQGPGRGDQPIFGQPMGAAWGEDGRIYVADTRNSRIVAFDNQGRYLYAFGGSGIAKPLPGYPVTWKPGLLNYPVAVDVDRATGDVYVADFYNNVIEVFDAKGKWLRRFPDPNKPVGKGSGGFEGGGIAVTDVAVLDGKVYATDTYQVFVFDRWGHLLEQFGRPGQGPDGLDHPNGIAATRDGTIYVADSNHNRVSAFSAKGEPKWNAGVRTLDTLQETKNAFVLPRGVAVLVDGSIVVADPLAMQLVQLGEDGAILASFGKRGTGPAQFNFPNDVDAQGNLLLVADRGNNRVQVVELVRK